MSEVENVAGRVAIIRSGEIVEVAETSDLTRHTLNRLTVRFKRAADVSEVARLAGVEILSQSDPTRLTLQVTGDMEELVRTLGRLPVLELETEHLSLEEVFLTYYKN